MAPETRKQWPNGPGKTATGASPSSGTWVPSLAVQRKPKKHSNNDQTNRNNRNNRVLGSQSLAVRRCEVLTPGCSSGEARGGGAPGQPLGVEIPLALRQLRDVTPPGAPLAEDADVARSLRFYFLTARIPLAAAQVEHLISPERLAFGSAPLPRVAKKRPRYFLPFSLADLITRLRQPGHAPPCLMLAPARVFAVRQQRRHKSASIVAAGSLEDSPTHRQRVSKASKGLQLTLQASELVSVKQRKDQLRDVGGKVIMCLNDRRPQGIWQAVKRAVSDGFKWSFM